MSRHNCHRALRGVIIIVLASGAAQPATAAATVTTRALAFRNLPKSQHMQITYKKTWTFKSRKINRCVRFTASGTIKYVFVPLPNPRDPPPEDSYRNVTLVSPTLIASATRYASGKCRSPVRLAKLSMGQHWTGYACSFNPSLSVSYPWGISFGGWPSCGKRNQAGYTTAYGRRFVYHQYNSGSPSGFGNYTVDYQASPPCYGVAVSAVVWRDSGNSDSYGASNEKRAGKVCLKKPKA